MLKIGKQIEIRAKGGNFLLNVGPKPDGTLQIEQQALLQEVALWNFANSESIYKVKPLPVIHEGNVWYTQSNDEKAIYAYVLRSSANDWKNIVLTLIQGSAQTKLRVLGYKSELVEYKKDFDAGIYVTPTPQGLLVSAVNGQRFYTNNQWPNAVVLKIEGATFRQSFSTQGNQSAIDGAK